MKREKLKKFLKGSIPYVLIIIVVVLIRSFIITPAVVSGDSMLPNLKNNNIVMLNKINYKVNGLERFDIIVLDYHGEKLIKRVIGLPGEHVEYKDNTLYINKEPIREPFKHANTEDIKLEAVGYITIPGDYYFVVGDNRKVSVDSRMIGLINKKNILGKVSLRIFPLNKFGKIKNN